MINISEEYHNTTLRIYVYISYGLNEVICGYYVGLYMYRIDVHHITNAPMYEIYIIMCAGLIYHTSCVSNHACDIFNWYYLSV